MSFKKWQKKTYSDLDLIFVFVLFGFQRINLKFAHILVNTIFRAIKALYGKKWVSWGITFYPVSSGEKQAVRTYDTNSHP